MEITAYTINAFAKGENGGNPAGIVQNADALTEKEMRQIAAAVGFSETAFLLQSTAASFRLRYFTPAEEVDLCGHATIGTFSFLKQRGLLQSGSYTAETKAGILSIRVAPDGAVLMSQGKPQLFETVDGRRISDSLSAAAEILDAALPPQIVSTGLRDIMVPVRSRAALDAIRPDFAKIAALSREYGVVGYHIFTRDTLMPQDTAYCRNFAPLYGISEEAATGTSSGALACYLMAHGQLRPEQTGRLTFEQGYSMGRPSEITAALSLKNNKIETVFVGGHAAHIGQKIIVL